MERGEFITTNTHLNDECLVWYLLIRKIREDEFKGMYQHLSTVIAQGSNGLALHWRILPGNTVP